MKRTPRIVLDGRQLASLSILAAACLIGCGLLFVLGTLLHILPGASGQQSVGVASPVGDVGATPEPTGSSTAPVNPYVPTPVQISSASGSAAGQVTQLPPLSTPLTGHVILTENTVGIMRWDFASNTITPVFLPPQNGLVASASLSPDGKTIVMAYAPPPVDNKPNLGYTNLYTVAADGSSGAAPMLQGDHSQEFYFTPVWSPDGEFIYYGHYIEGGPTYSGPTGFFMERMAYPSGQAQVLLQYGFVPHLTPDGSKLVYISVDPNSYLNNLFVASADGTNPVSLIGANVLWAIDAVAISPDSQTVIFGADSNGPAQSSVPWYYAWLGIRVAQAHSIPEDLYSVPITGGPPKRLTNLGITWPSVAFSPDGQHVLVIGSTGAFLMNPDGSGQTTLISQPMAGSVQWEP